MVDAESKLTYEEQLRVPPSLGPRFRPNTDESVFDHL